MTAPFMGEIDTQHLPFGHCDAPFVLSSAHLVRLAEQCHYRLQGDRVLFGLRAAATDAPLGQWLNAITVREQTLDYEHMRCLIGIWDRKQHKIAVFNGSTVPHIKNVQKQRQYPLKKISNQLSQGLYHYFVGAHEPDGRPNEEGAFRLTRMIPVPAWRDFGEAVMLDSCVPNDHIHAAGSEATDFLSAGCQVISGFHQTPMPTGQYQQFRILAGQSAVPSELEIHLPYQYLLMHVRHLSAIAQGWQADRLLMGSEGHEVRALQETLISQGHLAEPLIDKGVMNGHTVKAVYDRQLIENQVADGIHRLEFGG